MDDKLIKLFTEFGDNAVWAFVVYQVADFLKLALLLGSIGYGVKWLFNKSVHISREMDK